MKKPCRKQQGSIFMRKYYLAGVVGGVVAGAVAAGRAVSPRVGITEDFGMKTAENKQSNAITAASTQVPFSNTSVVCLTPMNWELKPAILPANQPPFGF